MYLIRGKGYALLLPIRRRIKKKKRAVDVQNNRRLFLVFFFMLSPLKSHKCYLTHTLYRLFSVLCAVMMLRQGDEQLEGARLRHLRGLHHILDLGQGEPIGTFLSCLERPTMCSA